MALSVVLAVLGLAICGLMATADEIRCVDAAREAARLTARGEAEEAKSAATRIAPANATITITTKGEHIEVDIQAAPTIDLLPGVALHATAFAVREPGDLE